MTEWTLAHPQATPEMLGLIPQFLSEHDPRPAKEQLHEAYAHGGGWHKFEGFTLMSEGREIAQYGLQYPGDPEMRAIGYTKLRDELIILFEHAWVCIVQSDGSYEIARMD